MHSGGCYPSRRRHLSQPPDDLVGGRFARLLKQAGLVVQHFLQGGGEEDA